MQSFERTQVVRGEDQLSATTVGDDLQKVVDLLQQILEEVYNTDEHTFQSLEAKIDKLMIAVERLEANGNGQGD